MRVRPRPFSSIPLFASPLPAFLNPRGFLFGLVRGCSSFEILRLLYQFDDFDTAVPELLNVSNIYGVQIANVGSPSIVRLRSLPSSPYRLSRAHVSWPMTLILFALWRWNIDCPSRTRPSSSTWLNMPTRSSVRKIVSLIRWSSLTGPVSHLSSSRTARRRSIG